ncbi:methionyl-tRNA formyltransferase [Spongiactinospora gelatinilytica]|uniref:Methionyl-tRNA formyltransferase n=1 Tax=Spongiactinospora gelatinilytica TaxID=2666298 RepID=A0A2W2FWB9_9ACTN|nr:formyltransferase family protein [Spongiactinospora gelatinilytica]PZG28898.1 methionyl-tRNA formyltransferase [Spongiactinospora gelatinilytica]
MSARLRVAIASYGPNQFALISTTLAAFGHEPAVYLMSRSMRPNSPPESDVFDGITATISAIPAGIGLLLPSGPADLHPMMGGFAVDLLVVFGFNWRIPADVISAPRFGTLNIHPSLLPRYRGPSPIPWAIRNGDKELGVTIHRMTETMDGGPILTQGSVGDLPEVVSHADTWRMLESGLPALLSDAISRVLKGDEGVPQREEAVSHAPFPPAEWNQLSWDQSRRDAHNQIRVFRFLHGSAGPVVELDGRRIQILRTSLSERRGPVVQCADGPLWISDHAPA